MRYSYCDISRSKLASRIMLVLYYHYRWRSVTSLSLKHKTWRELDIKTIEFGALLNDTDFKGGGAKILGIWMEVKWQKWSKDVIEAVLTGRIKGGGTVPFKYLSGRWLGK